MDAAWPEKKGPRIAPGALSRLGTDEETAELVLGHIPQGMANTCNLYDRLAERRAALESSEQLVLSTASRRHNLLASNDAEGSFGDPGSQ